MKEKYHLLCKEELTIPIFSQDWWLDTVCGKDNWDVLLIEEKGRIEAAMPYYRPSRGIITMPCYTQTMGPWFAPTANDIKYTRALGQRQALCKALLQQLDKPAFFLQNFNHQFTDWLPFYWAGYKQSTRYTYLLQQIDQEQLLWNNMSIHTRRNITKAKEKYQITIKKGISIDDFLRVQALTFERQQLKNLQKKEILIQLIQICRKRNQGDLWGAYDPKGQLHAVAFIVWQQHSAYYLAGGGDPKLRNSGAQSLLLWNCIRFCAQYTSDFDFEGSMIPGVERFFREFGAIQTPYFTITRGKLSLLDRIWLKIKERL